MQDYATEVSCHNISVHAYVHMCINSVLTHNFVRGGRYETRLNSNEAIGACKVW